MLTKIMQQQTTSAEESAILQCIVTSLNTRVATIPSPATISGVDVVVVVTPATVAIHATL